MTQALILRKETAADITAIDQNLSETLASANALSCDLAFDLDGPKREELLGVAQLIELAQLLAERVHKGIGQSTAAA